MPNLDGTGPRWLDQKLKQEEMARKEEMQLEKMANESQERQESQNLKLGVGPCGNGIPYGCGHGYCGGRNVKRNLYEQ